MIRILYVSHSFPLPDQPLSNVGGMQRVAVELHAALRETPGVHLSTRVLETSWEGTGRRMIPFMAGLLGDLPARVKRERIDVVLFSSMVTASVVALLGRRIRKAGAITAAIPVGRDVTLPNPLYQRFVPRVLRQLDLVLPISRATGDECIARGLSDASMRVIPCGVDLARFSSGGDRREARGAIGEMIVRSGGEPIPAGALVLCSVGRHQERKGFHWFAERVMPRLPDDVVYLVGGEGPTTPRIREAAERAGVAQRVRLLGRLSEQDLILLYRASDLFVMPNVRVPGDIEGFGVVMLEAGASGLPVIAAEIEGIRDVIRPGANGELIESGDVDGFVQAVERFRADRERLRTASRAATEYTVGTFGWAAIAERFREELQRTIDAAA